MIVMLALLLAATPAALADGSSAMHAAHASAHEAQDAIAAMGVGLHLLDADGTGDTPSELNVPGAAVGGWWGRRLSPCCPPSTSFKYTSELGLVLNICLKYRRNRSA